ncbi:MAG: D-2-hydroxyacid dehydrogenase [Deltaproteobacteria bacterium]|nr:D-2-hydroxyacid dehydrogenase [Deltaproteobacteria bacterium]
MNLLVLNPSAEEYKKALGPKFPELTIHPAIKEEESGDFIGKAEILLTNRISDALMKKAIKLQWIQATTTGVDYLVNLPSLRKEVLITSTRGIHGPQMSEMAILLMLALSRNLPQVIRNQDQKIWNRWSGKLLYQKKVGIVGLGAIGREIAKKCKAFGMVVYGIATEKREVEGVDYSYGIEGFPRVLKEADYLILVVPNTPGTRKMIGAKELSMMKPTAYLINIARGEIVDEEALVHALRIGRIAGAALDVFNAEPLPADHPFWELENVILTPHLGGMSENYVTLVLSIFEENLRRFLQGERRNLINFVER